MAVSVEFGIVEGNNGYIVVSANGGINQQRVAVSSVSGRICCFYGCYRQGSNFKITGSF